MDKTFGSGAVYSDSGVRPIPKVSTGIAGLDDILEGGVPENRITVITGGPGSGKTGLGLEFAYRSALSGEPVVFVTFEERSDVLRRNAWSMGWDLAALEKTGMLCLIDSRPGANVVQAGDFDLTGLLAILTGQAKAMGARRLVIDAIDVLLRVFNDPFRERSQLHRLSEWLPQSRLTTVLTSRVLDDAGLGQNNQYLEYMADCLIRLDIRVLGQIATRRLRVIKYRGSAFGNNEYPCVITQRGIHLLPISKMGLRQVEFGEEMTAGNSDLDEILGGGYLRGSSVMISGSSGIGKTTMLCTFARAACARGERVFYVNFEESMESMTGCMKNVGIELQPALEDGGLRVLTATPESMGAEEHLVRILENIEDHRPDHVIVDAVSATLRIGSRQAAFEFLMRLISICKERNMTCLVSNQDKGGSRMEEYGTLDISTLIDSILLLRYSDDGSAFKRLLLVMKSRGRAHSNRYYEYRITEAGIEVIGPYAPFPEHRSALGQAEEVR